MNHLIFIRITIRKTGVSRIVIYYNKIVLMIHIWHAQLLEVVKQNLQLEYIGY